MMIDDFGSDDSDDSDDDLEEDFRALQQHRSLKRKLDNTPENEDDDDDDDTVEDLKMSGFGNNEDDEDFIVDDIENEEDDNFYQPRVYTPCVDNGVNLSGLTNQCNILLEFLSSSRVSHTTHAICDLSVRAQRCHVESDTECIFECFVRPDRYRPNR